MTRPVKGRCSSCGGSNPDPLFWWLCSPCRRRIEGEPVDLNADEVFPQVGFRRPAFGTRPEDKRVYKVAPILRRLILKGSP